MKRMMLNRQETSIILFDARNLWENTLFKTSGYSQPTLVKLPNPEL